MGNPSSRGATKRKNQASVIQFSVNIENHTEFSSSSKEHGVETINIELEKVQAIVAKQAKAGDNVKLKLRNKIYEVFLNNQIIGCVPAIFTPFLMPYTQNNGRIFSVKNEHTSEVVITVQKYIR